MTSVVATGSFDDFRVRHMRLLHAASKLGNLHVMLWSDAVAEALQGAPPKFSEAERLYFVQAVRYVSNVVLVGHLASASVLPDAGGFTPDIWAVDTQGDTVARRQYCTGHGIEYCVFTEADLAGFPVPTENVYEQPTDRKKVIVTGCYDWLHSGHIRFFEEVSGHGDLYVAVGNDANVRHLKGEGHPMFSQELRRYMVQSIRFVTQAVITKGMGWMDAAPNVEEMNLDAYAVNEDGDRPEKRAFCEEYNLEYIVLKREPKEGLTPRSSTRLRGF